MISCIFAFQFTVCIQKMYNHFCIYRNYRSFCPKKFLSAIILVYFTYFDRKFALCRLWKNLWKVCITFRIELVLWCYENRMQILHTAKI